MSIKINNKTVANYIPKEKLFAKLPLTIETVGNLTNTDGVVSGFSGTDYLTTYAQLSDSWRLTIEFNISDLSVLTPLFHKSSYNRIFVEADTGVLKMFVSPTDNEANTFGFSNIVITTNTDYILDVIVEGTVFTAKLTNKTTGATKEQKVEYSKEFYSGFTKLLLGSDSSRYLHGTLNLNNFEIDKGCVNILEEVDNSYYRMGGTERVVSSTSADKDWNNFTDVGTYKIQSPGPGLVDTDHAPTGEFAYGMLYVMKLKSGADAEDRTVQLYFPNQHPDNTLGTRGGICVRTKNGTTWYAWKKINTKDANDAIYVNLTGTQTISGVKTFTGTDNTFSNANNGRALTISRTGTGNASIRYSNNNGVKGFIGVTDGQKPVFTNGDGSTTQNLLRNGSENTAVGSTTKPVYIDANGVAQSCTYSLNKDVPSNAVFTDNDTKNTAGSTDTSSKIFLIGATAQNANPQTYSHDTVFVDTSGQLNSTNPAAATSSTVVATTKWVTDKGYLTSISSHNQASNTINAMTGYSKPSSTSAIAATDTLNAAIGKLEKALDGKSGSDVSVTNTLNTTVKAYITGTTNAATNTGGQIFDTGVYLTTTAGKFNATTLSVGAENVAMVYNSTTQALEFNFA